MSSPEPGTYLTPAAILWSAVALIAGGVSMGFNPLFATSAVALVAGVLSLLGTRSLANQVTQGILRALAIVGIMGGLGGVAVVLHMAPGLR